MPDDIFATIRLDFGGGRFTLSFAGPVVETPVGDGRPAIGVRRDAQGRYEFVAGVQTPPRSGGRSQPGAQSSQNNAGKSYLFAPNTLPQQLRAQLANRANRRAPRTLPQTPGGASSQIRIELPNPSDLWDFVSVARKDFISYREYQNRRVSRTITPGQAVWWPNMTSQEYEGYVSFCRFLQSNGFITLR